MSRKTLEIESTGSREDQAIEWLVRLRRPELDPEDAASFAAWLQNDPGNPAAFDRAAALWELAGNLPARRDTGVQPAQIDPVRVDQRFKSRIGRTGWALAATVLAAIAGLQIFNSADVYQTLEGEQQVISLEDGTRVWLNTDSKVLVDIGSSGPRSVTLEHGEAFFDVQRDTGRPFHVHSASGSVEVLGTRFNVWEHNASVAVDVESGKVRVFTKDQKRHVDLVEGQGALSDPAAEDLNVGTARRLESWRHGRIVYDSVPLDEVVQDLDRYLPGSIALADEKLGGIEVSAVLRLEDREAMLTALTTSLGLGWSEVPGGLRLISVAP